MIFYYTVTSSLYWQHDIEEVGISKLEEQAAQLEKDLFVKERETLDVLKELEATKVTKRSI